MLNWECYEILVSIALLVVSQYMSWNANLGRESLEPKKNGHLWIWKIVNIKLKNDVNNESK